MNHIPHRERGTPRHTRMRSSLCSSQLTNCIIIQDESNNALSEFALHHNASRKEVVDEQNGELILLTQTRYDVSDDLTIIGCTLWSALNREDLDILSWSMTDFKRITSFSIEAYQAAHIAHRVWLNSTVENIRTQEPHRRVVVFTHHAPTTEGTSDPRFQGGPNNSAFSSELTSEPCWGPPVVLWGFGHTHWACDFVRSGVRVMSNPRGYDVGAQGYDATKVLEL
ncbi:hypothetical protein BDN72DRAFT_851391 [Pluteus cervinus]|uniref:Uncharacterized protein n=1 Tax=Pluteus cervinus TaxID=181527 RepID=A0ACD3A0N9_9AGAR|nr:hypothetical protein BDN72DRAFT_851391 [Pluteus cervinus]